MITIAGDDLAREYAKGLLTAQEYAVLAWQQAVDQHAFLAMVPPAEVLAAIEGLDAKVARALIPDDPMLLARRIVAMPATIQGTTYYRLGGDLVLRIWPQLDAGPTERWAGGLEGRGGRVVTHFGGPWVALHYGTLIVIALDNADRLAAWEAAKKERTAP